MVTLVALDEPGRADERLHMGAGVPALGAREDTVTVAPLFSTRCRTWRAEKEEINFPGIKKTRRSVALF